MSILNPLIESESDDRFILQTFKRNELPPDSYFEEEHKLLNSGIKEKGTFYDKAMKMEIKGAYDIEELTPQSKLLHIKEEIKIRTKINAVEIFKIGRLLRMAKIICRENNISFKEWILNNCEISYETCVNFMHAYKNCLGFISVAIKLPPSILYKISQPSFPEELRTFLFEQGNIESITNMDLSDMVIQYKAEGFEAIREKVDIWNYDFFIYRQTQFVLDICKGLLIDMKDMSKRINNKFGYYKAPSKDKNEEMKLLPEAKEINKKIFDAINNACSKLENVIEEADDMLFQMNSKNKDKLKM